MEKCTLCKNLVDRGDVPACVQLHPARARFWGDLDDPDSDVSHALESRTWERLDKEFGTEPGVYYLV